MDSKLDKFIIPEDLMLNDKEISAKIIPFGVLDHWSVHLAVKSIGSPHNRPFRFENIWLSHPDFISIIDKWWLKYLNIQGTRMFLLQRILKHIKIRLED